MANFDELRDLVRRKIEPKPVDGTDKVLPLPEAIRRFVRPGMLIHLGTTPARPVCSIYELVRQFRGQRPDFTVSMSGFVSTLGGNALVRAGLVKKVITSYTGATYPNPTPSKVYQTAYAEGTVAFEHWSLLTHTLRLKAAALGVPFTTTRSIVGSSMERDNADSFQTIDDPFEPGQRAGLLKALRPDVSIIHGLAADANGTTLLPPPWHENTWGGMAAREGAIVTVERIVSTDFIRRHNHFARLPGSFVRSVSEVPFGAHPSGVNSQGLPGIYSYADDYDFLIEARQADRSLANLDTWMENWIFSVDGHQGYLDKLGFPRLYLLRGKAQGDSYTQELESLKEQIDLGPDYNAVEHMVAVSARLLTALAERRSYRTILAGIGTPNIAAWMANVALKEEGLDVDLIAEIGLYGYMPRPGDPFVFSQRNIHTCKELADVEHVLGVFASGSSNRCLGALGAAQVDRFGNINSTVVPPNLLLLGSGGGNDVASGCLEAVITTMQSRSRFLEEVPYITSPGRAVSTLVSNLGVYEKLGDDRDFTLTGYLAPPEVSEAEAVRDIKEQCGWELKVAPSPRRHAAPSLEELRLMRAFDPHRQFLS